jgi:isoleucyl-tRNA synthetase
MQTQLQKVEDLIMSEVNVKEIQYLLDTEGFIKKKNQTQLSGFGQTTGS